MPSISRAFVKPWREADAAMLRACVGLMTDIDDTLTRGGVIEASALSALARCRAAGLPVIAITGRPMGWSLPFARDWPVDAIVAENGAMALHRGPRGVEVTHAQDEPTRLRNRHRLDAAAQDILQQVAGATLAADSAGRVTDIAIDHSEHATLGPDAIRHVVALMQAHGMTATVSSIHVNGWFGDHSKWTGACRIVRQRFGRDLEREADRWVYVGDSTNDQVMFERLPHAVGVANLLRFADAVSTWPTYLTTGERGDGVAEVVDALLMHRQH